MILDVELECELFFCEIMEWNIFFEKCLNKVESWLIRVKVVLDYV